MSDEQIEVKVEEEAPVTAQQDIAVDVKPEPATTEPAKDDETLAELKRQHKELLAKDEANRREIETRRKAEHQAKAETQRAHQYVAAAKERIVDSDYSAIVNTIAALNAEADAATREYQTAFENADGAKLAEAQRKIARAESRLQNFEQHKVALETRRPTTQGRVDNQRERQQADPFEAAISGLAPRLRDWVRSHPDVVTNDRLRTKAAWVDQEARAQGLSPDKNMEEYIAFAEQQLYPQQTTTNNTQQRPRSMPAAPSSRENTSTAVTGKDSTMVTLTAGERANATDGTLVFNTGPNKGKVLGLQEMAKRKLQGIKDGAYNRSLQN